jgi:N-acetylmuramoyl-L-alanine amidase
MPYEQIVISSGHGKYVRGASDIIDEVEEARKVTESLASSLRERGVNVTTYHDDVSHSQSENLNRITDFHNSRTRQLDISVHFNAYEHTSGPRGVEVLYVTQEDLAGDISQAISDAGDLTNRGAKYRGDLHFLNSTEKPAVLLEVCFVDSEADVESYEVNYPSIIQAIATVLGGESDGEEIPIPPPSGGDVITGKVSSFGGPDDTGVSPSEGLAFIYDVDDAPQLFLPYQPSGTSGLARRLNPHVHYFALRFDYSEHPKNTLLNKIGLFRNPKTGFALKAFPADWGPHEDTGRIADLSPSLMDDLGLVTDDEVEIIFPYQIDV